MTFYLDNTPPPPSPNTNKMLSSCRNALQQRKKSNTRGHLMYKNSGFAAHYIHRFIVILSRTLRMCVILYRIHYTRFAYTGAAIFPSFILRSPLEIRIARRNHHTTTTGESNGSSSRCSDSGLHIFTCRRP